MFWTQREMERGNYNNNKKEKQKNTTVERHPKIKSE